MKTRNENKFTVDDIDDNNPSFYFKMIIYMDFRFPVLSEKKKWTKKQNQYVNSIKKQEF
jgi:hypothetical protein